MADWPAQPTALDRALTRFAPVRAGEGRSVLVFGSYALLMMLSYYILKTIREPLLLTGSSAAIKSYAYAAVAGLLLILVPVYGLVFRHTRKQQLTRWVSGFFLLNLAGFYLAGRAGYDIGFAYYVWVGIFSVMITAQFWAFAADSFNIERGRRLFPLIMVGATLGGLLAPSLSGTLFASIGPWTLMLIAMALLALTLPLVGWSRASVPPPARAPDVLRDPGDSGGLMGGLALVVRDRYLLLLALLILMLNWVNTAGEYILAELVVRYVDERIAAGADIIKADYIANFYGTFFFTVNLLTVLFQVFAVARIMRRIGVGGAIMVLPLIAMLGYGLVVFVPVFTLVRLVKTIENATDYSLMNTARHALYLPLPLAQKYEGKTTIEAFFWRFGDLLQAGGIYIGLNWLHFGVAQFALVNMLLCMVWAGIALMLKNAWQEKKQALSATTDLPR